MLEVTVIAVVVGIIFSLTDLWFEWIADIRQWSQRAQTLSKEIQSTFFVIVVGRYITELYYGKSLKMLAFVMGISIITRIISDALVSAIKNANE